MFTMPDSLFRRLVCVWCSILGVLLINTVGYGDDATLAKLEKLWQAFSETQQKGTVAEFQEYQQGKVSDSCIVKIKGDRMILRHLGRDNKPSMDDRVYVRGPEYLMQLSIAKFPKSAADQEKYNLVALATRDMELDPDSSFTAWFYHGEDVIYMPVSLNNRRLATLAEHYAAVEIIEKPDGKYVITFDQAKSPKSRDRKGTMTLSADGKLESVKWLIEDRNADGQIINKVEADRDYHLAPDTFSFGDFSGGKFVGGYGQRANYAAADVSDAEFTPDYYGIDPRIAVGRVATNWYLWCFLVGGVVFVGVGVWTRRNRS